MNEYMKLLLPSRPPYLLRNRPPGVSRVFRDPNSTYEDDPFRSAGNAAVAAGCRKGLLKVSGKAEDLG